MNNQNPPVMQAARLSPRPRLSVNPSDIICTKCARAWSDHFPGCEYAGVPLVAALDGDRGALAAACSLAYRFAVAAVELLDEANAAILEISPMDRGFVLPDLSAALDAAITARDRLSRRIAVLNNPPEVQSVKVS